MSKKDKADKDAPVASGNVAPSSGVGDKFGADASTDPVESAKDTLRKADHGAAGGDRATSGNVSDYGGGKLERDVAEPESAAERKTRYSKLAQAGIKMDGTSAYEEYEVYKRNVNALRDEGKEIDLATIERLSKLKEAAKAEVEKHGLDPKLIH